MCTPTNTVDTIDNLADKLTLGFLGLQLALVVISTLVIIYKRHNYPPAISKLSSTETRPFIHFLSSKPYASLFGSVILGILLFLEGVLHMGGPSIEFIGFVFSHTTAALFSFTLGVFHYLAAWQLSSIQLRKYMELDKIWLLKGLTHKAYIHEALTSVRVVAKEIQHRIDQGIPDGREIAELRSHMGIHDTEVSALPSREKDIRSLMTEQDSISTYFFTLDKKQENQKRILEELFLHILKTTVVPLMERTSRLVDSKDSPVFFPESYAPIVWGETLKTGRPADGTFESLPSATCLFPFDKFRENYEKAHKPISKARRLYILSDANGNGWKNILKNELTALDNGEHEGIPKPMTAESLQAFPAHFMCHFAWIVDYHKYIGWELKFMELTEFHLFWQHSSPADLKHMDFLVASCINSISPIVFSVDMNAKDDGVKQIGLRADMRAVQVFWDNDNRVIPFYKMIWDEAHTPQNLLTMSKIYNSEESLPNSYLQLMNYLEMVNNT